MIFLESEVGEEAPKRLKIKIINPRLTNRGLRKTVTDFLLLERVKKRTRGRNTRAAIQAEREKVRKMVIREETKTGFSRKRGGLRAKKRRRETRTKPARALG